MGEGRKFRRGKQDNPVGRMLAPVLMVEIAIGDGQRLGRTAAMAVDLVGK